MKEIFRSSDMTALSLKKQFLAENDIPSRILFDGIDVTDSPINPKYGAVYHLDHDAVLVVDDEDAQAAYDFLSNIEIPIDDGEPIRNRFGQTGQDIQNAYKNALRWIARLIVIGFIALIIYLIIRY